MKVLILIILEYIYIYFLGQLSDIYAVLILIILEYIYIKKNGKKFETVGSVLILIILEYIYIY